MLRSFIIYLSQAGWARNIITNWSIAWRFASRFIAGETMKDALTVIDELNKKGINATIDHLGEHTKTPDGALKATDEIISALDAIDVANVRSNVSIKLTQIGLVVDPELCVKNLEKIINHAADKGNFVRIDMEDSQVTQNTLDFLWRMHNKGYENVGAVIQAYLFRSEEDTRQLAREGVSVRLCKGAYKEPPHIAFPAKSDVNRNFDNLTVVLVDGSVENSTPELSDDGKIPPIPAIASHDEKRIDFAKKYAYERGLSKQAIEFQMLNGIRRELQESLVSEGYPVRVYVPYGTEWYPYMMRRLAERPANLWFFISNFFRQ